MTAIPNPSEGSLPSSRAWLDIVRRDVEGLRFGVVQIVVHDARVVQIERTERTRLEPPAPQKGGGRE